MQTALIVLALAIIALLIFASTKPGQYTVRRSVSINASAEKIHATINTPREFERWSPYSPKDPQMTNTYSGAASGVGARNEFAGNGRGQRLGGDHSQHATQRGGDAAHHDQALRGRQRSDLQHHAPRRCLPSDLGDDGQSAVFCQADQRVHQHGQDDWAGF
jgi:hypothetical protein